MARQSSADKSKQVIGSEGTARSGSASSSDKPRQTVGPDMTNKIKMVGRSAEIEKLLGYLRARKARHFLYYWAHGGLGKTRLLEELLLRMQGEEPGYHASGIIDLYHTDTHSNSDVERAIVEGVDAERHWFHEYRTKRQRYRELRELGADSRLLETRRAELSKLFVAEFNLMADAVHKIVLTFDTVELLQYESSLVEEQAGLDTVDTRLKPWLLQVLPQLRNVLVVFAGRRKEAAPGEQTDPQMRLENDLTSAFGDELEIVELQPLTREEAAAFIHELPDGDVVLPEKYWAVAHKLTGGRPIFLHLLVDLLRSLAENPQHIRDLLDDSQGLVDAAEDDTGLKVARQTFQATVLESISNSTHEWGQYLKLIALMPKGVDRDILADTTGFRPDEADDLLKWLQPLSFVKEHAPLARLQPCAETPGALAEPQLPRLFLHDEMYTLLTTPEVMQNLRMNERRVARDLASAYYTPRIAKLQAQLAQPCTAEARIPWRERLHKLQVEQLYYLLAQDPRAGYQQYRSLSDQASRERQVGFGMQLLDEFLRFYNTSDRRLQFKKAGIAHEQVIRENALLWLERFHWWAQYDRAVDFASKILADPAKFHIAADDAAIMGNAVALWARARTVLHGHELDTVAKADRALAQVREAVARGEAAGLARARLATSIGYSLVQGGHLDRASGYNSEAQAAFRERESRWDELAMLLNNQSWLYASQGAMILARPLAREALKLNEEHQQRYSTGLTLSTLATIENIDGNWREAQGHAEEAEAIFNELEDAHGRVLALLAMAQAKRKRAKYEIQKGRKRDQERQLLEEARNNLETAIELAERAGLRSDTPSLFSKLGKVYRELGRVVTDLENSKAGSRFYLRSDETFRHALMLEELNKLERAGMLVDYAEMLAVWGNAEAARMVLAQFVAEWTALHGQPALDGDLDLGRISTEYLRPLGKFERLQGQLALVEAREEEALQHYGRAFVCFQRFSPTAKEKETMVELLYDDLRTLSAPRKRELVARLRAMSGEAASSEIQEAMESFVTALSILLGV